MLGSPLFSFWISITLVKIYISCIPSLSLSQRSQWVKQYVQHIISVAVPSLLKENMKGDMTPLAGLFIGNYVGSLGSVVVSDGMSLP